MSTLLSGEPGHQRDAATSLNATYYLSTQMPTWKPLAKSYFNDNKVLLSLSVGHSAHQLCISYNLEHILSLGINTFLGSFSTKTQLKTTVLFNLCFIMSYYLDMTMLPKIALFRVLQSKEIMSADVVSDNHEIIN